MLPIPSAIPIAQEAINKNLDIFHDTWATKNALCEMMYKYQEEMEKWKNQFLDSKKVNPDPDSIFGQIAKITEDYANSISANKTDKP